jgi:hypothetical protein
MITMRMIRNVAFAMMAALALVLGHAQNVHALLGCDVTEGYGSTHVSGECSEGCAGYYEECGDYCDWLGEETETSCEVPFHFCEELVDPPPAAVFSCDCLCFV